MDLAGSLLAYAGAEDDRAPFPVESWHPPDCGAIDMVIRRDGTWWHEGTQILRPSLVRLFSRLLRRDGARYVLVTPVEKVGITVEDVPFIAVTMDGLTFRTNLGEVVTAGQAHPLRFETDDDGAFVPYVRVRGGLDARLSQGLARDLADRIEMRGDVLGIAAADAFFAVAAAGV